MQETTPESNPLQDTETCSQEYPQTMKSFDPQFLAQICVLDTEMIIVRTKRKRKTMIAAQVTITDFFGNILLHTYAYPASQIISLNTQYSGIQNKHLEACPPFSLVRRWVLDIIWNKIIVGHAISNDLNALKICHPPNLVVDTQKLAPVKHAVGKFCPSLKDSVKCVLDRTIQTGSHSSYEDALATADLFRFFYSQGILNDTINWGMYYNNELHANKQEGNENNSK